jgi:hypothetical protein
MDREEARRVREEDIAFRREQFERGILEQRRNALLPLLLERREQDEALQQAINGAVGLGFDRPAAEALQKSGQLGFVMSSIEANNYAPERISAISEEVMRQLGDRADEDTVAAALLGVVESGADLDNPTQTELAIVESVLNASSIEELESLYGDVAGIGARRGGMSRFDISLGTTEVDLPEVARVRNEVIRRLQPIFGPNTFEVSASGDYTFTSNAPADTVRMVNRLTDQVVESATRAGEGQMTTTTAIQTFTNPILDLTEQGPVDVSMINANLPVLFTQGQDAFFGSFSVPDVNVPEPAPAPGVSEPAVAIDAIINRPLSTEPTSGFGFNVDEELN